MKWIRKHKKSIFILWMQRSMSLKLKKTKKVAGILQKNTQLAIQEDICRLSRTLEIKKQREEKRLKLLNVEILKKMLKMLKPQSSAYAMKSVLHWSKFKNRTEFKNSSTGLQAMIKMSSLNLCLRSFKEHSIRHMREEQNKTWWQTS